MYLNFFRTYTAPLLLITLWWLYAFSPSQPHAFSTSEKLSEAQDKQTTASRHLTPIDRNELLSALQGDTEQMLRLLSIWQIDAELLRADGYSEAVALTPEKHLRTHVLGRELAARATPIPPTPTVDDMGRSLDPTRPYTRFLPQTYVSAAILLSLVDPEQIVALPKHMKKQGQLYPPRAMEKITLGTERHNSEKLFLLSPEVAFIAHYSQPSTIQSFVNQGIHLFELNKINNIEEIIDAVQRIGNIANSRRKGELLALFIEAAFCAIDNRIHIEIPFRPKTLFLNYFTRFSIPTSRSITGQLLLRAGASIPLPNRTEDDLSWNVPLDQETLINLDPQCLIVSSLCLNALKEKIIDNPAFQKMKAVKSKNIFVVDNETQETPTHYIALAYFDIYDALRKAQAAR